MNLLAFVDVMYGVVLGSRFDLLLDLHTWGGRLLFLLAFVAMAHDWLYVHRTYGTIPYKHYVWEPRFWIDLLVLFLFWLLFSSLKDAYISPYFWLWFGLIFLVYAFWDLASLIFAPARKCWSFWCVIDLLAFVGFLLLWWLWSAEVFWWVLAAGITIYAVAAILWYYDFEKRKFAW